MASLADFPNRPIWATSIWFRCKICKVCLETQDALIRHKELKHLDEDDSSDSGQSAQIDISSGLSTICPDDDDDDVVPLDAPTPPIPLVNLNSSSESSISPEPVAERQSAIIVVDDSLNDDEEQLDESFLEEILGEDDDNIILPDPNNPTTVEESQNNDEEIEIESDTSPIRRQQARAGSYAQSQKSSSSSARYYPCPFCRKKFSTQVLKENHVENCQRPFNYRKKNYTKRTPTPTASSSGNHSSPTPVEKNVQIVVSNSSNSNNDKPGRSLQTKISSKITRRRRLKTLVLRKQPKRKASNIYIKKLRPSVNIAVQTSTSSKEFNKRTAARSSPKRKLLHKCQICQQIMPSEQSLQLHVKQHMIKDKPFLCNICKARFVTKPGLTRHLITKHSKFRNYELSNC